MIPVFKSFLQAGYECSTHKLRNGTRLDLVASTNHDRFVSEDYALLSEFGIRTVREGLRWPLISPTAGVCDFCTVLPFLRAARKANIEIIWDLLHFGWPDYLDIFSEAWIQAFTDLAFGFAQLLKNESPPPYFVASVNEISFVSWGGGDVAYLNPFEHHRGVELKNQLVKASLSAIRVMRAVLPELLIVSPEPAIYIAGRRDVPDDQVHADHYRVSMFEAWDRILGRSMPELGGFESAIDILGVNYYDRNQWRNCGETLLPGDPDYKPFHLILEEIYNRYRRPVFVSETGTENDARPAWFSYIYSEMQRAITKGIPLQGLCLYPILNHPTLG